MQSDVRPSTRPEPIRHDYRDWNAAALAEHIDGELVALVQRFVAWMDGGRTLVRTGPVVLPSGSAWLRVEVNNEFRWFPTEDLADRGDPVKPCQLWIPPMNGWTERWRAA